MAAFSDRKTLITGIFVVVGIIFLLRLFQLQVADSTYKRFADNNALRKVVQYPARGLIYDRNHELLVYNKAAYDLLVIPRRPAGSTPWPLQPCLMCPPIFSLLS